MKYSLLVLLVGCRVGFSEFRGTLPRTNTIAKLALHAASPEAAELAREVYARDPNVAIVEAPPDCAPGDHDYYVVATLTAKFDYQTICDKEEGILDKNPRCVASHREHEHTAASFQLSYLDPATCRPAFGLSYQKSSSAAGDEEQSGPQAIAQVVQLVRTDPPRVPTQIAVGADGIAKDAEDGLYAVFRGPDYLGLARTSSGAPRTVVGADAAPGDRLVRRGRVRYLALVPWITATYRDGQPAAGGGLAIRTSTLETGLQGGAAVEMASGDETLLGVTGEFGIGRRLGTRLHVSVDGVFGFAIQSRDSSASTNGGIDMGIVGRAVLHVTNHGFLGFDAGGGYWIDELVPIGRFSGGVEF